MNQFKITLAICLGFFGLIVSYNLFPYDSSSFSIMGVVGIIFSIFYTVVGLFSIAFKESRISGKAILLSAGIIILLSVVLLCMYPLNFSR